MTVLDMLRNGVEIETLCGQIYAQLERASKEAAKVFAKMSLEEEKHAAFLQHRRDMLITHFTLEPKGEVDLNASQRRQIFRGFELTSFTSEHEADAV